jgi:predicted RNA binding protein YcfA (HicA-like mRNA interferase family)
MKVRVVECAVAFSGWSGGWERRRYPVSPRLPVISGRQAVCAFERLGYEVVRQRGSHLRLRHREDPQRQPLTIPDHDTLKPLDNASAWKEA